MFEAHTGTIYLVRHGKSEANDARVYAGREDSPITENGKQQAHEAGNKLIDRNITTIVSSPLTRAFDTATVIGTMLGIANIQTDDALIERDFGELTGMSITEAKDLVTKDMPRPDSSDATYLLEGPGMETFPEMYARATDVLERIALQFPDENVLLVSHGEIMTMLCAAYYGRSWEEQLRTVPYFKNTNIGVLAQTNIDLPLFLNDPAGEVLE